MLHATGVLLSWAFEIQFSGYHILGALAPQLSLRSNHANSPISPCWNRNSITTPQPPAVTAVTAVLPVESAWSDRHISQVDEASWDITTYLHFDCLALPLYAFDLLFNSFAGSHQHCAFFLSPLLDLVLTFPFRWTPNDRLQPSQPQFCPASKAPARFACICSHRRREVRIPVGTHFSLVPYFPYLRSWPSER